MNFCFTREYNKSMAAIKQPYRILLCFQNFPTYEGFRARFQEEK